MRKYKTRIGSLLGFFALLLMAPAAASAAPSQSTAANAASSLSTAAGTAAPPSQAVPPAKKEWILGISVFSRTSPERMGKFSDLPPMLAELAGVALLDKEGGLSISLPSLLAAKLSPLPSRYDDSAEGKTTVSLLKNGEDGSLVDPGTMGKGSGWESPELSSLDGFISGFYSLRGNNLDVAVFCYEKGKDSPVNTAKFSGGISSLENFTEIVLPGILSWVAQKPLGLVDVETTPPGASLIDKSEEPAGKGHAIAKSRIFIYDKEEFPVGVLKNGYKDSIMTIDAAKAFGNHTTLRLELMSLAGDVSAAAEWAKASPESLNWKEKPEFLQKEQQFHAALGRFVVSLPFSVISAGAFLLYSEAYSRSAAGSGALNASEALMAACISVSAGFIIDTAIRLVQVLRVSR
jgi:hypothetical protein